MAGCRRRSLQRLEQVHVCEVLGTSHIVWPQWVLEAWTSGRLGLGPGTRKITLVQADGAQQIAEYDVLVQDTDGAILRLTQTQFDQNFEVID